jgi:hypothetical protein
VLLERTHGFITTEQSENVQEISGNFVGPEIEEVQGVEICFKVLWDHSGVFSVDSMQ